MNIHWFLLVLLLFSLQPAFAQDAPGKAPLQGRVETIQSGQDPELPADLLQKNARISEDEHANSLPADLNGRWYGTVQIEQMETYPHLHPEPYCQSFIGEIGRWFHLGQKGKIILELRRSNQQGVSLVSSDVLFGHGLKLKLNSTSGPALVPGGTNMPRTVRNNVVVLGPTRVEQTRIDYITIIDDFRRPLHSGFSETTSLYELVAPKHIKVKLLSVDYDQDGKPLWKSIMAGEATK